MTDRDWIYLDDAPENIREHTFFSNHCRTQNDHFALLRADPPEFLIRAGIINSKGDFIARTVDKHERERGDFASPERRAGDYEAQAIAFVGKLLASVSPADRVKLAAPGRDRSPRGRVASSGFDFRHPEIQERHRPYLDLPPGMSISGFALQSGRTQTYGSAIRAEVIFALLVKGQIPPFVGILDGRGSGRDPEHVGPYASVIVSTLFREHEHSLLEAERRGIYRTPVELLSRHARLLGKAWQSLTAVKVGRRDTGLLRTFLRVTKELVDACHEDAKAAENDR